MKKFTEKELDSIGQELDAFSEMHVYVNLKTGEIHSIPNPDRWMGDIEEEQWQEAHDRVEDEKEDLLLLERMSSYDAFKVMESFAEQVEDAQIQQRLFYALNKDKPFKNFKYEIDFHDGLKSAWFAHKNAKTTTWVAKQIQSAQSKCGSNEGGVQTDADDIGLPKNRPSTNRQTISSGAKWEDIVGYSRAVRVGNIVEVAGTTAVDVEGNIVGLGDAFAQTTFIIQKIERALEEAGAQLSDVVRTRIYVTNIQEWEAVGKAHGAFFRNIKPASAMVEVSGLVNPDMLVEIEVTAVL